MFCLLRLGCYAMTRKLYRLCPLLCLPLCLTRAVLAICPRVTAFPRHMPPPLIVADAVCLECASCHGCGGPAAPNRARGATSTAV